MHAVRPLCVFVLAFALSGCINSATLLKVKPDGAGTIEQTILMNTAALKGLLAGLDAQAQAKTTSPFNEAEFQKMAASLGKGVRFVSSTPLSQGGFEGAKALFEFDDVSAIRIQENPEVGSPMGGKLSMSSSAPVTFGFARKGANSVLTVTFDEKSVSKPSSGETKPAPNIDPMMLGMMKTMFQGFKIAIDLEVDGTIVKTNADYVNGSRITLLELELAGLLEDEAKLRELQGKVGASLAEIRPFLKDVKGVKVNHSVVTVEYR
jgi:hypothetical protein